MTEKFAVYIPGSGFESVVSLTGGAEIIQMKLAAYRAVDQWPADIESMGLYEIESDEGGGLSQDEVESRIARGVRGGYRPLFLVREVPGSRVVRRPCTHCDIGAVHTCEECDGTGYLDPAGNPWEGGDLAFRVQYEFDPATELLDDDGLGFPRGCANMFAILGAAGVLLAIWLSDLLLQWWR